MREKHRTPRPPAGLAEGIASGDVAAEALLVDRYYDRVFGMILARTCDQQVAGDLAQDVMLSVVRALRRDCLRDRTTLPRYICAAARNRVRCHFREVRHRQETALTPGLVSARTGPEERCLSRERGRLVRLAAARLGPSDRRILALTLVDGLRPREIALCLGLRPDLVRKRKSRALRRLRELVRQGSLDGYRLAAVGTWAFWTALEGRPFGFEEVAESESPAGLAGTGGSRSAAR